LGHQSLLAALLFDHLEEVTDRITQSRSFKERGAKRFDEHGPMIGQLKLDCRKACASHTRRDVPAAFLLERRRLETGHFEQV
jgi:hypothetical protein